MSYTNILKFIIYFLTLKIYRTITLNAGILNRFKSLYLEKHTVGLIIGLDMHS
jgi:hypothetical protein